MKAFATRITAALAALLFAASAYADIGSASVNDVTLDGRPADAFAFASGWNPHAGPDGDTSGFGSTFDAFGTGAWEVLDKYDHQDGFDNTGLLTFTFNETTGTMGDWSVTNTSATMIVTLDLVFAIHAGGDGGAWLFDNETIQPGETLDGTWRILWENGGGNHPEFSNLTLFGRDMVLTPVPEPATYGMLLLGLGALALRRRGKS